MKTIDEAARMIAKNKTVLNDRIKFSTEADLRSAEYVCYKSAIEMAEFIQKSGQNPKGGSPKQILKTVQTTKAD
jgi:hypothetical protein